MTKTEFINELMNRVFIDRTDATIIYETIFDPEDGIIARELNETGKTNIFSFGTLRVGKGRVGFTPTKTLKKLLKEKRNQNG